MFVKDCHIFLRGERKFTATPCRNFSLAMRLEDVVAYCQSRKSGVNPKRFFDYYEASGWHDSAGKPVKNWKQKVITWEKFSPEQDDGIDPMILKQIQEEMG